MRFNLVILIVILSWLSSTRAAVILQYHHVSEQTPASTSISPALFVQHLDYLEQNDFEVVPLATILDALKQGKPIADNWVAITFDDGYDNLLVHAHDELVKRQFPYSIFVNPGLIDMQVKGYLSWAQLNDMARFQVEISNHTWEHFQMVRQLENESKDQWLARLQADIEKAEARIEEMTGQSNRVLVYPYGEFNHDIQQLLNDMNYIGVGQHSGAVGPTTSLTRVPRFPANGRYAGLNSVKVKLHTLAFDIIDFPNQALITTQTTPSMTMTVNVNDFIPKQVQCYSGNEVIAPTWTSEQTFSVQAKNPLNPGRHRYNCTAPSLSKKGYYYWFSQPWMILHADGSWYSEN